MADKHPRQEDDNKDAESGQPVQLDEAQDEFEQDDQAGGQQQGSQEGGQER
jgi:hypothetical protein